MTTTESILILNFGRFLVFLFLLIAIIKIYVASKNSRWDVWAMMAISLSLISLNVLLGLIENFGIYMTNVREALAAAAGIIAASALFISSKLIKKECVK